MDTTGAGAVWLLAIMKMMSPSGEPTTEVAKAYPPAPAVAEAKAPAALKGRPTETNRAVPARKPLIAAVQGSTMPLPISPKRPPG